VIAGAELVKVLGDFLPGQRWYAGSGSPDALAVRHQEVLRPAWPGLVRAVVDADAATYQVLVGLRPALEAPEFLRGRDDAVMGEVATEAGPALAYEAVLDAELGLALLEDVAGGTEGAERVRPLGVEQSNSSLVYDERLILKLYRRLHPGRNRDVEVTRALTRQGFTNVAPVLATSELVTGDLDFDLGALQPYLGGAAEGWALAQTSLRDFLGMQDTLSVPVVGEGDEPSGYVDPAQAGGDFSAEARRLGAITAQMHRALAEAFGTERQSPDRWAEEIERRVAGLAPASIDAEAVAGVLGRLRELDDPVVALQGHGDLHLAQALRTDAGWFLIDFEGEPARPPADRWRRAPGLRDVAGMLRSFHYAAQVALLGQPEEEADRADAWEARNRGAFFDGYAVAARRHGLLPSDPAAVAATLAAFELEKAAYELAYEEAYRPDWAVIPRAALARLGIGTP